MSLTRRAARAHPTRTSRLRATALLGAGALIATAGLAGLGAGTASASSHREAPGILDDPQYDNTDLYAFNSPDKSNSVTIIANWNPFEEPAGGPNYFPWATDAHYDINIDNNGDAKADLIYRWTFTTSRSPKASDSFSGNGTFLTNNGQVTSLKDRNLLFRQTYDLTRIDVNHPKKTRKLLDNAHAAPAFVGDVSMPDYRSLRKQALVGCRGGGKSFAGQAEDPFFLDLRVFDLLYGDQGTCNKEIGNDTLAGYNVNSIALQVPRSDLTSNGRSIVGVWTTTERSNHKKKYVQISRLGNPLVNEAVIPYQAQGHLQRHPAEQGRRGPAVRREARAGCAAEERLRRQRATDPPRRPGRGIPDRAQGTQPAQGCHPQRGTAVEHQQVRRPDGEPSRCHRWRQERLPERPSPDR